MASPPPQPQERPKILGVEDEFIIALDLSETVQDLGYTLEGPFEGTAQARSRTNDLPALVPNLVEAMFTNVPGRSGAPGRITVPPARKRSAGSAR